MIKSRHPEPWTAHSSNNSWTPLPPGLDQSLLSPHGLQKPPCFSGDGDPLTFLNLYDNYAELLGWDEPRKLRTLPLYTTGAALPWFESLAVAHKDTWDHFIDAFNIKYDNPQEHFFLRQQLGTTKMMPNESVEEYFNKMNRLFRKLTLDPPSSLHYFISGLPPQILEWVIQKEPATLEQAKNFAQIKQNLLVSAETNQGSVHAINKTHQSGNENTQVARQMHDMTEKMCRMEQRFHDMTNFLDQRPTNSTPPRQPYVPGPRPINQNTPYSPWLRPGRTTDGQPICYACNQVGHTQYCCPPKETQPHVSFSETPQQYRRSVDRQSKSYPFPRPNLNVLIHPKPPLTPYSLQDIGCDSISPTTQTTPPTLNNASFAVTPQESSVPPNRLDFSTDLYKLFLHLLPVVKPPSPEEI